MDNDIDDVVHREPYFRDDIEYEIIIIKDAGYWGKWYCVDCKYEAPGSSKLCTSIDKAILAAQSNISGHHFSVHKKGKK